MKITRIIKKIDDCFLDINLEHTRIQRGDTLSVIYCEVSPELVKMRKLGGSCLKLRKKGLNTKIRLGGTYKSVSFEQILFLHGPHLVDLEKIG